jgi:ketosteroid isomerase-like protein
MGLLEDKDEIRELMRRYNQCIDFPDVEGWLACFTDDAVVEIGPRPPLRGIAELRAYAEQRPGGSLHLATSEIIDVQGDVATMSSYVAVVGTPGGEAPRVMVGGRYTDTLRRVDGAWKFAHRVLDMTIRPGS